MTLFEKTDSFLGRYKRIVPVTKALKPVFNILFYILCVLLALFIIIALIMIFVNVNVDKMLLPPDMNAIKDSAGNITSYSLKLGNGIQIISPASEVTLTHVKLVIYAKLCAWCVTFLCAAPVFKLISMLFANISKNKVFCEDNAKYINYTGIIIIIGDFLFTLVNNVFNYEQVRRFVTSAEVDYSFDIQWFGIIMGLFIIVIGTIYGYACSVANNAEKSGPSVNIIKTESTK
ncbi:DUF2975 domain-containing protein [bacterium]|nr:DUF2975 domain-containing protein [bacterium]